MTLIVYKNKQLAADTRGTLKSTHSNRSIHTCAHCGKPAKVVNDKSNKIHLFDSEFIRFRGDQILTVATAGNSNLSNRFIKIIEEGKDLEQVYQNYLSVHGDEEGRILSCTLLISCKHKNYLFDAGGQNNKLSITEHELDDWLYVGKSSEGAEWISRLMPNLSAAMIINLAMAVDDGVGGQIEELDLCASPRQLKTFEKKDPDRAMAAAKEIFRLGEEAFLERDDVPKPRSRKTRGSIQDKATQDKLNKGKQS